MCGMEDVFCCIWLSQNWLRRTRLTYTPHNFREKLFCRFGPLAWVAVCCQIFFFCAGYVWHKNIQQMLYFGSGHMWCLLAMMIWPNLGLIGYWNGLALVWSMSIHTVEPRKPRLPGTGIVLVIFGLRQVMVGILIRKHMEATSINQSIPRQSSPMWYWYHYQSMSHYHYHQSMVPV